MVEIEKQSFSFGQKKNHTIYYLLVEHEYFQKHLAVLLQQGDGLFQVEHTQGSRVT